MAADLSPLEVEIHYDEDARLIVRGEIDVATVEHLEQQIEHVLGSGISMLVLDLSGVTFCGSAGLPVFVGLHDRIDLWLRHVPPMVAQVLRVTGLDEVLQIEP